MTIGTTTGQGYVVVAQEGGKLNLIPLRCGVGKGPKAQVEGTYSRAPIREKKVEVWERDFIGIMRVNLGDSADINHEKGCDHKFLQQFNFGKDTHRLGGVTGSEHSPEVGLGEDENKSSI